MSLTASVELEGRVRRVVAFNTYDYPKGVARANRVASIYVGGARLPLVGPVVTAMENKPVLGVVLRGGLLDESKLPSHYLAELRRAGRRRGYARVAREIYSNVDSMVAARALYPRVSVPVTLIYGDHDWSRLGEREADFALLQGAESVSLSDTGHFAALEQPAPSRRSSSPTVVHDFGRLEIESTATPACSTDVDQVVLGELASRTSRSTACTRP
jgi:pimeloyl-ACP methyl ester carboxylesterase